MVGTDMTEDKGGKEHLLLYPSFVASLVYDHHSLHRNPVFKPNLMSLEVKFKSFAYGVLTVAPYDSDIPTCIIGHFWLIFMSQCLILGIFKHGFAVAPHLRGRNLILYFCYVHLLTEYWFVFDVVTLCLFIRDTENIAKIRKNIENRGIMSVKKFNA